jgi:thiamine kinase-like enzyme
MAGVDIEALVARAWSATATEVRPLPGGITNRNYVVTAAGRQHVVRIPGERTALLGIDRANELEATVRAAQLGIGPAVLGILPEVGTVITEFVPGEHRADLTDRVEAIARILTRFHGSGPLHGSFMIHRVVEAHAADAAAHGVTPPASFERLHECSRRIEAAVHPRPAVPCHNDLLPANLLFHGDRIWLLDYEYAGMNDAFFDLGNLSVNGAFDGSADERLVRAYLGRVTASALARLSLMKLMSEFREGMWAVVQQAISSLETDFAAYADEHLRACERLVASADFAVWLADARADPLITR